VHEPRASAPHQQARGSSSVTARFAPRLGVGEVALVVYVTAAVIMTLLYHLFALPSLSFFAASPHAMTHGRWWTLITSGFLIVPPLMALQAVAVLVLGFVDIRLCGARVFWTAVVVAHVLSTLLVYCAIWLIEGAGLASISAVSREPDYGISLVWFAGAGVLATALGKRAWPGLRPAYRGLLLVAAAAALLITILFDRSGHYEHAVALPLSAMVVLVMWREDPAAQGRGSSRAPRGHASASP
jgi:hypothetical protein